MVLVDWKRCRALYPTAAEHYQLQLSLYRDIIKESSGIVVNRLLLVLLHPDNDDYRLLDVPYTDTTTLLESARAVSKAESARVAKNQADSQIQSLQGKEHSVGPCEQT